jgi:HrpA-like RNA helicase
VGITSVISGTNRVPGTDIIFMTDGALVQESAEDKQLSHVRVLIIDEAHERSLNTDIVMGIAKLLLKTRPTDFYVVISSATINPSKFLEFFERSDAEPLNVPGRVYDVHLEYLPKAEDSIERHAVSTLKRLYNQHEGTTLVFLPGQGEIEIAMDLFKRDLPGNCVPLPLYAALSLEEQDQVLQFDEGPNGERRMVVFCTNIAETSLTIKNTRVVIDSGLAKEAYVDKQLRSTAIQTIAISKASADQRKGRAGRTAPVTAFVSTPKTH